LPGHPLGLTLPTLADTPDVQAELTIAALQAIVADLEGTWAISSVLADAALDMQGFPIVNTGGINLTDSGAPTVSVGDFYRSGNDAYYMGALGAVRITNGATLNFSSTGGFTGDLSNMDASFTHLTHSYAFKDLDGTWCALGAGKLVLESNGHAFQFQVDAALPADKTYTIYAPPDTGTALLAAKSDGSLKPVSSSFKVDQDVYLGELVITAPTVRHGNAKTPLDQSSAFRVGAAPGGGTGWTWDTSIGPKWTSTTPTGGDDLFYQVPCVEGEKLESVSFRGSWTNDTFTVGLYYFDVSLGTPGFTLVSSHNFTPSLGVSRQSIAFGAAGDVMDTLATRDGYYIVLHLPATATASVYSAVITTSNPKP